MKILNNNRICHLFFDEFPKDSRIRRFANVLLSNNYEVYIICLSTEKKVNIENIGNLHIYRIPLKKKRGSLKRRIFEYLIFEILAFLWTTYLFFKFRIKLFHISTLPDFLIFSCIIPKLLGANLLLDFHELFPEAMLQFKPSIKQNELSYKIILFQEKLSYLFANEIIVFHDPAKDILNSRMKGAKTISTIMNGFDESELPQFSKKTSTDSFRIIYNGTINKNLNLSLVLYALQVIKLSHNDIFNKIIFEIYGEGPDLQNLLNLAKKLELNNIFFGGRVSFSKMIECLQNADVCVLPPKKDIYSDLFYSLKLTEMIFFKIPVIATRLNTYKYYFPEDCILYFNSDDHLDLADKIIFTYFNKEKTKVFTYNAFRSYQKVSWDIMKIRYLDIIKRLTN